jgi:hypothetical protein
MVQIGVRHASVLGAAIFGLAAAGAARAQAPSEAIAINRCLCMQQEISQLSANMSEKMTELHRIDQRLAFLSEELRRERVDLDVNNPTAVEHYKALLEEHDAIRRRSVGPVWTAANDAVARYNASVREYNVSCSHSLFNSVLLQQIRATLTCPAPGYALPAPAPAEYSPAPGYMPPAAIPSAAAPTAPPMSPGMSSGPEFPPAPGYTPPPYPGER